MSGQIKGKQADLGLCGDVARRCLFFAIALKLDLNLPLPPPPSFEFATSTSRITVYLEYPRTSPYYVAANTLQCYYRTADGLGRPQPLALRTDGPNFNHYFLQLPHITPHTQTLLRPDPGSQTRAADLWRDGETMNGSSEQLR